MLACWGDRLAYVPGKNAIALTSMDCLVGASAGALGSEKAVWKVRRPLSVVSESHCLNRITSSFFIAE